MTYTGESGEVSAVHQRAGSEPSRQLGTTTARYLATGSLTADPDTPASMLILFAPGAPRERYFDGLAEIIASGRQLSEAEWTRFYAENDQYMV
jgi:hypothetical protein